MHKQVCCSEMGLDEKTSWGQLVGRGREERNGTKQIYVFITEDSVQKQRAQKSQGASEEAQDARMPSIMYQDELLCYRYKTVRCSCRNR